MCDWLHCKKQAYLNFSGFFFKLQLPLLDKKALSYKIFSFNLSVLNLISEANWVNHYRVFSTCLHSLFSLQCTSKKLETRLFHVTLIFVYLVKYRRIMYYTENSFWAVQDNSYVVFRCSGFLHKLINFPVVLFAVTAYGSITRVVLIIKWPGRSKSCPRVLSTKIVK